VRAYVICKATGKIEALAASFQPRHAAVLIRP
jgi:hypothetical protein